MNIALILKASKLCNLRCTYCYEGPELADRARMAVEQVHRLFLNLRDYILANESPDDRHHLTMIWHGGEPFAQPLEYWQQILEKEEEVFGPHPHIGISRDIQTNLTLVTERHLPLLRKFQIGFSFDVLNEKRINVAGAQTDEAVKEKVAWLQSHGIKLGGIAVISRANAEHPEKVAQYFLSRRLGFKVLEIYRALDSLDQVRSDALSFAENLDFFRRMYALPEVQDAVNSGDVIDPFALARDHYLKWRSGYRSPYSLEELRAREWPLLVNTNGDVYSPGDAYNPQYRYGNIFGQPMQQILFDSPGRMRRVIRSRERLEAVCGSCFLFQRGCDGIYVSHATPEQYRDYVNHGGCYYKHLAQDLRAKEQQCGDSQPASDLLYLNITYACNSRCKFCAADVAFKSDKQMMPLEDFRKVVGNRYYKEIHFSGGEPTIHPQIVPMIEHSRLHANTICLLTHGRSFHNRAYAERILQAGVNIIVIPLYGATAEQHDAVSEVSGSFAQTLRGMENLQELKKRYRFSLELKMLLTRYTAPLNEAIYELARDRFTGTVDQLSICPLIYSRSTLDSASRFSAPFSELQQQLLRLISKIRDEGHFALRLSEFPPCFFPESHRDIAHPNLNKPVFASHQFYADQTTPDALSMEDSASDFRSNVKGNELVKKCGSCRHRSYGSERHTPYFSTAYLEQFGEREFHPVS